MDLDQILRNVFYSSTGQATAAWMDIFADIFEDLIYIGKLVYAVVSDIPLYFQCLPPAALTLIITTFGIAAVYLILGRT